MDKLSSSKYLAMDADERAIWRGLARFDVLPPEALEDMRSISIYGASLAAQIIDEVETGRSKVSPSALRCADDVRRIHKEGRK